MKKLFLLLLITLANLQCSSLFYSILPRHKLTDSEVKSIEIGKTRYENIAPKLGSPRRIGHKANGNMVRLFRYFSPYPGSYAGLRLETDSRGIVIDIDYLRTNDDDLAFFQMYRRNHVFETAE